MSNIEETLASVENKINLNYEKKQPTFEIKQNESNIVVDNNSDTKKIKHSDGGLTDASSNSEDKMHIKIQDQNLSNNQSQLYEQSIIENNENECIFDKLKLTNNLTTPFLDKKSWSYSQLKSNNQTDSMNESDQQKNTIFDSDEHDVKKIIKY